MNTPRMSCQIPIAILSMALGCLGGIAARSGHRAPSELIEQRRSTPTKVPGRATNGAEADLARQLLARLASNQLSPEEQPILREAIDAWLLRDPVQCFNYLKRLGLSAIVSEDQLENAILVSCGNDSQEALKATRNIDGAYVRNKLFTHFIERSIAQDGFDSLKLIPFLPKVQQQEMAASAAIALAKIDPERTVLALLEFKNLGSSLKRACGSWASRNPNDAVRFLLESTDARIVANRRTLLADMFSWAQDIPPNVSLALLASLPEDLKSRDLLEAIYKSAAKGDPQALADELVRSRKSLDSLNAGVFALKEAAIQNPDSVAIIESAIPAERARILAFTQASDEMIHTGYENAARWQQQIEDPIARKAALDRVADSWVFNEPASAAEFAAKQLTEDPNNSEWMSAVVQTLKIWIKSTSPYITHDLSWTETLSPAARQSLAVAISARSDPVYQGLLDKLRSK